MGCASSKSFEKQRLMDRWISSPKSDTSGDYKFENYQHRFISLTSNSYGFLNITSPKGPKPIQNQLSVGSLCEMYEKFKRLETTGNVPSNEVNTMPSHYDISHCTKTCVGSTSTMKGWRINTNNYVTSETINVREMMVGLEEAPSQQNNESHKLNFKSPTTKKRVENNDLGNENSIPQHREVNMAVPHSEPRFFIQRSPLRSLPLSPFSQEMRNDKNASCKVAFKPKSGSKLPMKLANDDENGKVNINPPQINKKYVTPLFIPSSSMARKDVFMGRGHIASHGPISPLFDPELVASYEKKLEELSEEHWNKSNGFEYHPTTTSITSDNNFSPHFPLNQTLYNPFECFPKKCPPCGEGNLVIYTTTLRGIRKTFDDCNIIRAIFQSFGLRIDERDVSMHLEFLNELRELMGRMVSVPRVFIKGRYIGGIEDVKKLHENGKLSELIIGLPKMASKEKCGGCDGIRFVPCIDCRGSCKVRDEGNNAVRCPNCNENGLIQCPICT